jgi:hypothetical protein
MRFGFLLVYIVVLQSLVVSLIELQWTNGKIQVRNQMVGGFAAFFLAMVSAVATIVVLRSPPGRVVTSSPSHQAVVSAFQAQTTTATTTHESTTVEEQSTRRSNRNTSIRTPPRQAFYQHRRWRPQRPTSSSLLDPLLLDADNINDDDEVEDEDEVSMTLLEETAPPTSPAPPSPLTTAEFLEKDEVVEPPAAAAATTTTTTSISDMHKKTSAGTTSRPSSRRSRVTFCHKILVYQLGLLTLVLWMPCWYTPFMQIQLVLQGPFSLGAATATATTTTTQRLYWMQIPVHLWQQGREAGTDTWILVLVLTWMGVSLLILPILASILGMLVWLGEGSWCTQSRKWLNAIQPSLGGVVFSSAILLLFGMGYHEKNDNSKPNDLLLGPLEDVLSHWTFCRDVGCVSASAQLLSGAWFYVAHSLLLEVFVSLSLRWSLL